MRDLFALRRLAVAALDAVAPPSCLACDAARRVAVGLCGTCLRRAPPPHAAPCRRCAAPRGPGAEIEGCRKCAEASPRFTRAVTAGPYAGFLGELLRRAKYGPDPLLMRPLTERFREALHDWDGCLGVDLVVPVPSTRRRVRRRGFDPALLLARAAARDVGAPLSPRTLGRIGDPQPQASLPRSERRLAARGTVDCPPPCRWRFRPPVAGRTVLLVDDVLTTCATANACTRALLAAGAKEVRVAAVLRA